ncbi:hypothetical protein [Celerinatantimonas sp. MCCC 1A17872]|uniref:hypothetical protein n=1 Tax=Celerinatantimonas sp. MCCC 1A17872 TaxID=3177514 RepID=UPI0038C709CE
MSEELTIAQYIRIGALLDRLSQVQSELDSITGSVKNQFEMLHENPNHPPEIEDVELAIIGIRTSSHRLAKAVDAFSHVAVGGDENA